MRPGRTLARWPTAHSNSRCLVRGQQRRVPVLSCGGAARDVASDLFAGAGPLDVQTHIDQPSALGSGGIVPQTPPIVVVAFVQK